MADETHIELTVRLWSTGAHEAFERYIERLVDLLPRHRGTLVRHIEPVEARTGDADAVLVFAFPDSTAIDSFLRDPARADLEDAAGGGVVRSLITDGRTRTDSDEPGTVSPLRPEPPSP